MWRDIGTYTLIVGVLAESLLDLFWKEKQPAITLDVRTKAEKFCAWWNPRNIAILVVIFVVAIGIGMEMVFGDWADDIADQMRVDSTAELTAFVRLESGIREITRDDPTYKLKPFAGTTIVVRFIASPTVFGSWTIDEWWEAQSFAGSFEELAAPWLGWRCRILWKTPVLAGVGTNDVTIYSAAVIGGHSKFKRPPAGTPERKGWDAAHALLSFLNNDLNLWTARYVPLERFDQCSGPGIGRDAVCVEVGVNHPTQNVAAFLEHKNEENR